MSEPSAELVVLDPGTGELLTVRAADTEALAAWRVHADEARDSLAESEAIVSDELVRRLDREGKWTLRVGDPTVRQYEITAPSPTAGTDVYDERLLADALQRLVADDVISGEAASRAMPRRLLLELEVPWDADPDTLASLIPSNMRVQIASTDMAVLAARSVIRVMASGIAALRKVPGTAQVLDTCKPAVAPSAPKRRAKVTLRERP
jgi:hypothetical protein